MYGRTIGDEVLSFGHEGVLYRNSFIMYDRQSESLWVHVSGEAVKGPRKGQKLEFLPSEITTWAEWRWRHPMTTALIGEKADGFMGTFSLPERVKEFGLSIGQGRDVTLLRYTLLQSEPVFQLDVAGSPVVATFDPEAVRAVAFSRQLGESVLTFEAVLPRIVLEAEAKGDETSRGLEPSSIRVSKPRQFFMRDRETGSLWNRMTGKCVEGEMMGSQLKAVPATAWLGKRWKGFFPDGVILGLPEVDEIEAAYKEGGNSKTESPQEHNHAAWTALLKEFVHEGGKVDYKGLLEKRGDFDTYLHSLESVQAKKFESWSRARKSAFWINAYNAYAMKLVLDNYPIDSIKDLGGLFSSVFNKRYIPLQHLSKSHRKKLSLGEIEHELLYGLKLGPMFHFGIVCASTSCPELRAEAFSASSLNKQLEAQARIFLADSGKNNQEFIGGKLRVSKNFDWAEDELNSYKGGIRSILNQFAPPAVREKLSAGGKLKLKYRDYDWSLNQWLPPKN